jgi:choline dehydrogenase-like flavoprotein
MSVRNFDIVVIGSGPGGEGAAMKASKSGKKVCVVEKRPFVGGACTHTATIPSKALRHAVQRLAAASRFAGGCYVPDLPPQRRLSGTESHRTRGGLRHTAEHSNGVLKSVGLLAGKQLNFIRGGIVDGEHLHSFAAPGVKLFAAALVDLDLVTILEPQNHQRVAVVCVLLPHFLRWTVPC